jgi:hypothetical protein
MRRRVLLLLGVIVLVPAIAQAAVTVTVGTHNLLSMTAGQTISIMLSGASFGSDDVYNGSDWRTTIAAGGPVVTHVFGRAIAGSNSLAQISGSIWASGFNGINAAPDSQFPSSTGQRVAGSAGAPGLGDIDNNGIFLTLTIDTTPVGLGGGSFALSLTGHPLGTTKVYRNELDENGDPTGNLIDIGATLVNGVLNVPVVPEPSSIVLGMFAVAGLSYVAVRRHRARKAA